MASILVLCSRWVEEGYNGEITVLGAAPTLAKARELLAQLLIEEDENRTLSDARRHAAAASLTTEASWDVTALSMRFTYYRVPCRT
jgi:hypothetical protein